MASTANASRYGRYKKLCYHLNKEPVEYKDFKDEHLQSMIALSKKKGLKNEFMAKLR